MGLLLDTVGLIDDAPQPLQGAHGERLAAGALLADKRPSQARRHVKESLFILDRTVREVARRAELEGVLVLDGVLGYNLGLLRGALLHVELKPVEHIRILIQPVALALYLELLALVLEEGVGSGPEHLVYVVHVGLHELLQLSQLRLLLRLREQLSHCRLPFLLLKGVFEVLLGGEALLGVLVLEDLGLDAVVVVHHLLDLAELPAVHDLVPLLVEDQFQEAKVKLSALVLTSLGLVMGFLLFPLFTVDDQDFRNFFYI